MSGYGQFCPVAKAAEVLAERWTPLVVRELLAGSHRFSDLQRGVPLMSRALLSKRLKELERAGVVEKRDVPGRQHQEYFLTPAGRELRPLIEGLGAWGQRWILFDLEDEDLDPSLLFWDIRRSIEAERLPDHRVVVRFDLRDVRGSRKRWWLVADADETDVCMTDPGFEVQLRVETTLRDLTRYWIGHLDWRGLLAAGTELDGASWAARDLPHWIGQGSFAAVPRPERA